MSSNLNTSNFSDGSDLNCKNFERRVHQRLDERLALSGDRLLLEHAVRCAACDTLMRDYGGLECGLEYGATLGRSSMGRSSMGRSSKENAITPPALSRKVRKNVWSPSTKLRGSRKQKLLVVLVSIAAGLFLVFSVLPFGNLLKRWGESQPHSMVRSNSITPGAGAFHTPKFAVALITPTAPTARSWGRFSGSLESFSPYLQYTSELPGVRPMQCSVNLTIDLLQRSLVLPDSPQPDLGWFPEPTAFTWV